ncbi:MAG: hydrogenase maturation protease [Thermoplasmata archaeon]
MRTILIGLGNPLLTDDAIGIRAAESLAGEGLDVDVEEASVGGMELVEMMLGYQRAIIVDSILTGNNEIGTVNRITPDDFKESRNVSNLHSVDFMQALKLWSTAGDVIPKDIVIYVVEVDDVYTFSESMTPAVEEALSEVVRRVRKELYSP